MTLAAAQRDTLDRLLFALRDDELTSLQTVELEQLLLGDVEAMRHYLRVANLNAGLRWLAEGEESRVECRESKVSSVPPIILDLSPTPDSPLFALRSPLGDYLFSYTAAAVILGIALAIGWAWRISYRQEVVQVVPRAVPERGIREPEATSVGRITGLVDCRWRDPSQATVEQAAVPLGRESALAAGLLEITYQSGAKVLLQGPATYEIESDRGGFLSFGKLTARVESRESRVESNDRKREHSRLSTPNSGLFSVRTPTAVVTDLGTEFGVEVDRLGTTKSFVFRGKVALWVGGEGLPLHAEKRESRRGRVIELIENESVTVEPGPNPAAKVIRGAARSGASTPFIRELPRGAPIEVFSTGVGLRAGDRDPHWQILSWRFDQKPYLVKFSPIRETAVISPATGYLPNDPSQSQWISAVGRFGDADWPGGVSSFRTTFELSKAGAGSARLRGGFIADDRVVAVWLNDKPVPLPEQQNPASFDRFYPLTIDKGFVAGTNVLLIDVHNKPAKTGSQPSGRAPLALRVELRGFELRGPPAAAVHAVDKERRPTKQKVARQFR